MSYPSLRKLWPDERCRCSGSAWRIGVRVRGDLSRSSTWPGFLCFSNSHKRERGLIWCGVEERERGREILRCARQGGQAQNDSCCGIAVRSVRVADEIAFVRTEDEEEIPATAAGVGAEGAPQKDKGSRCGAEPYNPKRDSSLRSE